MYLVSFLFRQKLSNSGGEFESKPMYWSSNEKITIKLPTQAIDVWKVLKPLHVLTKHKWNYFLNDHSFYFSHLH